MSNSLGHFISQDGDTLGTLYNLFYIDKREINTVTLFTPWALFVIQLIAATLTFLSIFLYKHRALQMRVCSFCMILLVGWYIIYAAFAWTITGVLGADSFRVGVAASLPCVSLILLYLSFRGIMKDEKLVRSLDRLR